MLALTCVAFAAKEQEASTPDLPLESVPRFLEANDLREWRNLQREMEQAQADLETGKWLANKQATALTPKDKLAADRKKGEEMVKSATARITTLQNEMTALHVKAAERYKTLQAQFEPESYSLEIPVMKLSDLTGKPTEELLYKLWNDSYNRIYFGGAYVFDSPIYIESSKLSEQLMTAISRYDGNRYTLEDQTPDFTLNSRHGTPIIDFSDRTAVVNQFKSALVLCEIVFDRDAPSAIYSLYAIDLKTGELIAQTVALFPSSSENSELLGLGSIKAEASKTAPAADTTVAAADKPAESAEQATETASESASTDTTVATKSTDDAASEATEAVAEAKPEPASKPEPTVKAEPKIAAPLKLTLEDQKNFLGRLKPASSQYLFGIDYIGEVDSYSHRSAVVINKEFLFQQGFEVDVFDILGQIYETTSEVDLPDSVNVLWRVSPTRPVEYAEGEFNAKAIALQRHEEITVEIGTLNIEASEGGIPSQASK